MADAATEQTPDYYAKAASGLETAAKALRACGEEEAQDEAEETPADQQPKNLRDAARQARQRFKRPQSAPARS